MKHILYIFLLSALLAGCKDNLTGDEIDSREIPQKNIDYNLHLQPVLDIKCANAGCHEDAARAGGLSLTSCGSTTADLRIVFPGEPDNSVLIWTIEGTHASSPMPPPGYPPMTPDQIRAFRTWIQEGASCASK